MDAFLFGHSVYGPEPAIKEHLFLRRNQNYSKTSALFSAS